MVLRDFQAMRAPVKAFVTVFLLFLVGSAFGPQAPVRAQCYPGLACPSGETTPMDKPVSPASSNKSAGSTPESTASVSPTYKCDDSKTAAELVVCKSPELVLLDVRLDALYMSAVQRSEPSNVRTLRDEQRAWIQKRDECGVKTDCLKKEYLDRIAQLSRQ